MTITIKNKDIELNFGIEFVHRLDELGVKEFGEDRAKTIGFGCGLYYCVPYIMAGDYYLLAELLYTGTWYMKQGRPTVMDIENYLDSVDDLDEVRDEVLEELKKSGACKNQTIEAENLMKTEQAQVNQALETETQEPNTNE